jgi:hypothetical protein
MGVSPTEGERTFAGGHRREFDHTPTNVHNGSLQAVARRSALDKCHECREMADIVEKGGVAGGVKS